MTVSIIAAENDTQLELNRVMRELDQSSFFKKGYRAFEIIIEEQGIGSAILKGMGITAITAYTLLSAIFEQMGSAYSFKEIYDRGDLIGREMGDIGGWSPLAILDLMALKYFLDTTIAEANFLGLKKICQRFMKDKLIEADQAYDLIIRRLDELNSEGLFQKTVASRILLALEIVGRPSQEEIQHYFQSTWALDAQLEPYYLSIESDYKNNCSWQCYFQRFHAGLRFAKETQGLRGQVTSIAMGVILPLGLLAANVSSLIGEVKLGQQVIGEKDDLPAYGHLGEWLSNIVVNATAAWVYCQRKFILNPGDASFLERSIKDQLESKNVNENSLYYNRMCEVGFQELSERNSTNKEIFIELKLRRKNNDIAANMIKA